MTVMHIVRFTKFWAHLSVEEMGERAASLGYDGLDLVVRESHPIHPGNVAERLTASVRAWANHNIDCSLITSETALIDANDRDTRTLFSAAADAGVPRIKIGYFVYQLGTDYTLTWEAARRALDGFSTLARETGGPGLLPHPRPELVSAPPRRGCVTCSMVLRLNIWVPIRISVISRWVERKPGSLLRCCASG